MSKSTLLRSLRNACVVLVATCFFAPLAAAQVRIDPIEDEDPVEQLIIDALWADQSMVSIDVDNATFVGRLEGIEQCAQTSRYFDFDLTPQTGATPPGLPSITLGDGVLFTSGCSEIPRATGGITTDNTTTSWADFPGTGSDADLQSRVGTTIFDTNSIEFDFQILEEGYDAVEFTFVFATDEFPEADEIPHDIFDVILDGVGGRASLGSFGIVRWVPGVNNAAFNDNNGNHMQGISAYPIEYDGITNAYTVCTLVDPDAPDGVHTLKIAIADSVDDDLDSAAFVTGFRVGNDANNCGPPIVEPEASFDVDPVPANADLGATVPITATVFADEEPDPDATVRFRVTSGPNAGLDQQVPTDANGQASIDLSSTEPGKDVVLVSFTSEFGEGSVPEFSIRWGTLLGRFEADGWGEAAQAAGEDGSVQVSLLGTSGELLFFAAQTDGVYILDVSDPENIQEVAHYNPDTCNANGVEVPFFADDVFYDPLTYFIESGDPNGPPDPNNPDPNNFDPGCGVDCGSEEVQVMHVAAADCGVHVVKVSDLDESGPQFLSSYGDGVGSAEAVELYTRPNANGEPCSTGSRAVSVVAATESLDAYDVSDPTNPLACNSIPNTDEAFDDTLIVALDAFEAEPPEGEEEAGLPTQNLVQWALIATGDGARGAVIEDPSNLEILGAYITPPELSDYRITQHIRIDPDAEFGLLSSWAAGFQLIGGDIETEGVGLLAHEETESAVYGADFCGPGDGDVCITDGQMGVAVLKASDSLVDVTLERSEEIPIGPDGAFAWDIEADRCRIYATYGVFEGECSGGSEPESSCFASSQCDGGGECIFPGGIEVHEQPDCEVLIAEEPPGDSDGDGTPDGIDNCSAMSNDQNDADLDGYGDVCDADLSNDGVVGLPDFGLMIDQVGSSGSGDLSGDGVVGLPDFSLMTNAIGGTPGPSGLACAGTVPCP